MAKSFAILGEIQDQETFATGGKIRELPRLIRLYGKGRWRKRRGRARIRRKGKVFLAEVHWYEATGIGRVEFKIKRRLA